MRLSTLLTISCIFLLGCATADDFSLFEGETLGALIQKSGAIEADVATELALRATDRVSINNNALNNVLSVIQQLNAERRT